MSITIFIFISFLTFLFPLSAISSGSAPIAGFGHSLKFDGVDDFVDISSYSGTTGDFTIEFWVKPTNLTSGWKGFFGYDYGGSSTRSPSMWQNGNNWHCDIYKLDNTRYEVLIPNIFQRTGEWIHLAWIKDGDTFYYYRNGKQVHTRSAPPNGDYRTQNTLWIGKVDNHFDANYDEVRIWNIARTHSQINDYRYRYIADPNIETGLIHYYSMDEGTGTTLNDLISGGNAGTLTNGPTWESAASAPPITTPEDTPVTNYLKASDLEHDSLTFRFTTQPSKGTISVDDTTGEYTYTPNANATGTDSFTYIVNDGTSDSNTATINITITAVNDAPSSTPDHATIGEDGTLNGNSVVTNDFDIEGDHLSAKLNTNVSNGSLTLNADGTFIYQPNANFNGTDSFTYFPFDGHINGSSTQVDITITAVNDQPIGMTDSYSIAEDGSLTINAPGVLSNDHDAEANTLTAQVKTQPTHGTLSFHSDGSFTYQPSLNYNGNDSFTYIPNDGLIDGGPVTVSLLVNPINDAPSAQPDHYSTSENILLNVDSTKGLLANDFDPDGDVLHVVLSNPSIITTPPSNGKIVSMKSDGSFSYMPNSNYTGTDFFTYVATDGGVNTSTIRVDITINSVNHAPFATADSYFVIKDVPLTIPKKGVLDNDKDFDGNQIMVLLQSQPTHGKLHQNLDGSFIYTPDSGFTGTDTYTYKATDGLLNSNIVTVTFYVVDFNSAPSTVNDAYSTSQNTVLQVDQNQGILNNDSDPEANTLSAVLVTSTQHGILHLGKNGNFNYNPDKDYVGIDSFTYKASDGHLDGNTATVVIRISAVNHAPIAMDDSYSIAQDSLLDVSKKIGLLNNDSDTDGNILHSLLVTQPKHGSLHMSLDGSYTYKPTSGYTGTDSFTYIANDSHLDSNVATVYINIHSVNHAPIATADSYTMPQNGVLSISAKGILKNDFDVDGNHLSVIVKSQPGHGSLHQNLDGSFTYTPNLGFTGIDSYTYVATDGSLNSNIATVSFHVNHINKAPISISDQYSTPKNIVLQVDKTNGVLNNDSDPEANTLSTRLVTTTQHGTLHLGINGDFSYNPDKDYVGVDSFTYKANDSQLDGNTVNVTITVNTTNLAPIAIDDAYSVAQDSLLDVSTKKGLLDNDSDPDGDILKALIVTQATHGNLHILLNGSFSYNPTAGYTGIDSFTYKANDGHLDSNIATVNITIRSTNRAPIVTASNYITDQNSTLQIVNLGVLSNATDPDGDQLVAQLVHTTKYGILHLNLDGSFTYTPNPITNGVQHKQDTFSFVAFDGNLKSNVAIVTINITATNSVPIPTLNQWMILILIILISLIAYNKTRQIT
ncbi:MAG: tandem-95 repeat protein [gamma proteobacterium symbiont of Taylorina sp.]|nr:tandem-95 repeat protein [gamma proteobacterium symbiont of Taylorina sp.]